VRIEFDFVMGTKDDPPANGELAYSFCNDGSLKVDYQVHIEKSLIAIPRIGLELILPGDFEGLKYYGYGPVENYPDRLLAAILAVHDSSIEAQHFPFVPVCENGGHEGTRWLKLTAKDGKEISIGSTTPFHFDAHYNSADDYINAAHEHELIRRKSVFVHIDAAHGPIGSQMAWSTVMPAAHSLRGGSYALSLRMETIKTDHHF
jgi:beta-galactosidase